MNKFTDSIDNTYLNIATQVQETQDQFIFQTLSDFALNNYQITVEKEELMHAIQLIRMSREYGPSINERWITATKNAAELDRAYNKGLQDGIDKEHARVMAALNKMEEKYEQNN
jgi:hypothetical protein